MKAVIALSFLLLFAIVGCKEGKDGGFPDYSGDAYSKIKETKNKNFTAKFKAAKKNILNNKKLQSVLQGGSPFREGMPTNNLGRNYEVGDAAGKQYLINAVLPQDGEQFCSMTPKTKARRLIEASVDIQNSLHLLEIAMRMEDYSRVMQHAEALNNIPLDVAKQVMSSLMSEPNSPYWSQAQSNAGNTGNANNDPNEAERQRLIREFDGKTYDQLTPEAKQLIDSFNERLTASGQNVDKNRLVGLYLQTQLVALNGIGRGQGEKTKLDALINGRLVLPAGAKAPLQTIAEKYRKLLVLRSEVRKNYTQESIAHAEMSQDNLIAAEKSYNDPDLNNRVKEALKELSKVFPKSKFLKKKNQVFLNKLEINKSKIGLGKPFKDKRLDYKERAKLVKQEPKERNKNAKESNKDKAALERLMAYASLEEEAEVGYDELGDVDSLEQLMGSLLADSANFASVETARMFLANDPNAISLYINASIEDAGWPTFARNGQAGYRVMDRLLSELGGSTDKAFITSAKDIFNALKNNINQFNLGDQKKAIQDAIKYFDSVEKVEAYRSGSIFQVSREQLLAAEGQLRLSKYFITAFSPLREWKSIMCQAIKAKDDCNILDLYMEVANQPEQARDLTNQIRNLLGMKDDTSLVNRYNALKKALRDIVDITNNMNTVCKVGERLEGVHTVGLTDIYFYTELQAEDVWKANLTFAKEVDDTLRTVEVIKGKPTATANPAAVPH